MLAKTNSDLKSADFETKRPLLSGSPYVLTTDRFRHEMG